MARGGMSSCEAGTGTVCHTAQHPESDAYLAHPRAVEALKMSRKSSGTGVAYKKAEAKATDAQTGALQFLSHPEGD